MILVMVLLTTWKTQASMGRYIKMDLQEEGCGGMEWIELAQDWDKWWARVNAIMKLRVL
jgi:hypothetical protein